MANLRKGINMYYAADTTASMNRISQKEAMTTAGKLSPIYRITSVVWRDQKRTFAMPESNASESFS